VDKIVEAAVPSRNLTRVAVVGGSGYAGEELVRLLLARRLITKKIADAKNLPRLKDKPGR